MGLERALGGEFGLGLLITLILKRLERQHRDKSNSTVYSVHIVYWRQFFTLSMQRLQDKTGKTYGTTSAIVSFAYLSTHCPQYRSVLEEKKFPANMTPAEERGWFSSTVL